MCLCDYDYRLSLFEPQDILWASIFLFFIFSQQNAFRSHRRDSARENVGCGCCQVNGGGNGSMCVSARARVRVCMCVCVWGENGCWIEVEIVFVREVLQAKFACVCNPFTPPIPTPIPPTHPPTIPTSPSTPPRKCSRGELWHVLWRARAFPRAGARAAVLEPMQHNLPPLPASFHTLWSFCGVKISGVNTSSVLVVAQGLKWQSNSMVSTCET